MIKSLFLGKLTSAFFALVVSSAFSIAQDHPDLGSPSDYPIESRVWLSSNLGEVVVNPELPILVGQLGTLDWQVENQQAVQEDQAIALLDSEKIEISARELALTKAQYPTSLYDLEAADRERRKAARVSLAELQTELESLKMTVTERKLLGSEFEQRLAAQRNLLQEEITLLRKKIEGEYFPSTLETEKTALNLEIDKAEQAHDELVRDSKLRAETDGQLVIEEQDVTRPEMRVGMIRKENRGEARLELTDPQLRSIAPKELVVEMAGEDGFIYIANYTRTLSAAAFGRDDPVLVFEIEKQKDQLEIPENLNGRRMLTRVSHLGTAWAFGS